MLITKANPVGVDIAVQQAQTKLYDKLTVKWGTTAYNAHGRAYKNRKDSGYIAEVFTGDATKDNNDYREVYWDDTLDAISFFHIADKVENDLGNTKANAAVIFFVNLKSLKPLIKHRADEEVRRDVIECFGSSLYGFTYEGYETGVDNALREYPGSRRNEGLKNVDMQPVHCFRINLTLLYNNFCTPFKL